MKTKEAKDSSEDLIKAAADDAELIKAKAAEARPRKRRPHGGARRDAPAEDAC